MPLLLKSFSGPEAKPYQEDLARIRIQVFQEYPYLYQGSMAYERTYLEDFLKSDESLLVLALDGSQVVGASTATPLHTQSKALQQPWLESALPLQSIFYFAESVLLPAYRGQGLGSQFFDRREAWARSSGYQIATFCAVIRPVDHPARPTNYTDLAPFWQKRGFEKKEGYIGYISWQEIGESAETPKPMQFWCKDLLKGAQTG